MDPRDPQGRYWWPPWPENTALADFCYRENVDFGDGGAGGLDQRAIDASSVLIEPFNQRENVPPFVVATILLTAGGPAQVFGRMGVNMAWVGHLRGRGGWSVCVPTYSEIRILGLGQAGRAFVRCQPAERWAPSDLSFSHEEQLAAAVATGLLVPPQGARDAWFVAQQAGTLNVGTTGVAIAFLANVPLRLGPLAAGDPVVVTIAVNGRARLSASTRV